MTLRRRLCWRKWGGYGRSSGRWCITKLESLKISTFPWPCDECFQPLIHRPTTRPPSRLFTHVSTHHSLSHPPLHPATRHPATQPPTHLGIKTNVITSSQELGKSSRWGQQQGQRLEAGMSLVNSRASLAGEHVGVTGRDQCPGQPRGESAFCSKCQKKPLEGLEQDRGVVIYF